MTSCKDLLVITKKIEMTFHSIMASISNLGKMARTSAKSENPNEAEVISFKKSFETNFLVKDLRFFLRTNCKRAKDQHLHVQIVCMSYFYNSVY